MPPRQLCGFRALGEGDRAIGEDGIGTTRLVILDREIEPGNMDELAPARAVHVLAIVAWIGGVSRVTAGIRKNMPTISLGSAY
jgi:hypothetical protein